MKQNNIYAIRNDKSIHVFVGILKLSLIWCHEGKKVRSMCLANVSDHHLGRGCQSLSHSAAKKRKKHAHIIGCYIIYAEIGIFKRAVGATPWFLLWKAFPNTTVMPKVTGTALWLTKTASHWWKHIYNVNVTYATEDEGLSGAHTQ